MEFSERGGYGFRVSLVLCWQAHDFYETLSTALLLYTPQYCFIFELLNMIPPSHYSSPMCFAT